MKSNLIVNDLLNRKHFEHIEIIAGQSGLHRHVKWVHVVEVIQIRNLLKGDELILSTGLGWKEDQALFLTFIKQLIEIGVAGLCIELGTHTSSIPQEAIDLANDSNLPIIVFHNEVPFVEITQDIHALIINQHYQKITDLENYSQQLNKKLLTMNHYQEILTFMQQYLHVQVILKFTESDVQFTPVVKEQQRKKYLKLMEESAGILDGYSMARLPVQLLEKKYADLVIVTKDRELNEFDHLILDRTTTALAQHLLRDLYVEEKRKVEESEWINTWLSGDHNEDVITDFLTEHIPNVKVKGGTVCLFKFDSGATVLSNTELTYFNLYVRTIFEQEGFYLFPSEKRNVIILILLNKRPDSKWKERIKEGIHRILTSDINLANKSKKFTLGVGKYVERLSHIHKSYETAQETLRIQGRLSQNSQSYFYDDLHMFRLISHMHRHLDLQEVIMEYLEPVIEYDKQHNGKLMQTLKIYLSCNGSKQETAKQLFIVRQTLYHRIEKLETLLGDDFMHPEKRLAIEFMILAYEFLQSSGQELKSKYQV
ncbi:PucR family transcriptional regulator ligand-binding domain-containing protein [Bacillus timonensis]|nr:PucR family transcriptional regulator ligand-binding domain-containing protein [Bacillus timonensis]